MPRKRTFKVGDFVRLSHEIQVKGTGKVVKQGTLVQIVGVGADSYKIQVGGHYLWLTDNDVGGDND